MPWVLVPMDAGSLEAVFELSDAEAFRLDFDGGLGGEAEETALFLPPTMALALEKNVLQISDGNFDLAATFAGRHQCGVSAQRRSVC